MWFGAASVLKVLREVDASIEVEGAIGVDVNVQGSEVNRSVDQSNIACLEEVVCDDYVLLVWGDLEWSEHVNKQAG